MNLAPIALFVYNRPQHLLRTLDGLRKNTLAAQSDLFIFADGIKHAKDEARVNEVRSIIRSVKGFKSVEVIEQDTNKGLAASVIDGVTRLTDRFGKVIVMEDDLESSPYMLQYFNDALERYEQNERVMHIGGYMYPIRTDGLPETFFFRVATSWGWATWRRAWRHFEPDIEKLYRQFNDEKIGAFSIDRTENFWKQVNQFRAGKINSWAIRWYASVFLRNGLCLSPATSMTNNIGNDASGTHSEKTNMYTTKLASKPVTFFPTSMDENSDAYERIKHFYRTRKGSVYTRGIKFIKTSMKRLLK